MPIDGHATMHLRNDERGVTLPEVLVAVTILAIIIIPLGDAMIGFVRNTDATTRRMNESHDIQLASTYFTQDIQNLGVRDWTSPTLSLLRSIDNAAYPCTGSGTPVVSLAWDDPTTVSGPPASSGSPTSSGLSAASISLRRLLAPGARPQWTFLQSPTSSSSTTLSERQRMSAQPRPAHRCPCFGAGAAVPQRVTLTVKIKHPLSSGAQTTLTLIGQRRQS